MFSPKSFKETNSSSFHLRFFPTNHRTTQKMSRLCRSRGCVGIHSSLIPVVLNMSSKSDHQSLLPQPFISPDVRNHDQSQVSRGVEPDNHVGSRRNWIPHKYTSL